MPMGMTSPQYGGHTASEAIGPGHPDKVCDQLSDAVVDACLLQDPNSRVAAEVAGKTDVTFFGEVTVDGEIDFEELFYRVHREIGYDDGEIRKVIVDIKQQSPDIAHINRGGDEQGAGDQGTMVGYACNTPDTDYMPRSMHLAKVLIQRYLDLRANGAVPFFRPDCKSQVVMWNGQPRDVTFAAQHLIDVDVDTVREAVYEHVIKPVIGDSFPMEQCRINGTGPFVLGSFAADAGLTGRKIVCDQYGVSVPVGGGAFSGKDPTKVDRTAAYMARHIAKSMVAAGMAEEVMLQLAYTIGYTEPDAIYVKAHGSDMSTEELTKFVRDTFPLTPAGMIDYFDMTHPHDNGWSYQKTAALGPYGLGRDHFPWEQVRSL